MTEPREICQRLVPIDILGSVIARPSGVSSIMRLCKSRRVRSRDNKRSVYGLWMASLHFRTFRSPCKVTVAPRKTKESSAAPSGETVEFTRHE